MRRSILVLALAAMGCGATAPNRGDAVPRGRSALAIDLARTRPLGQGPAFRPTPLANPAVAAGAPVGRWHCTIGGRAGYGAHIELFASDHEVLVPSGIGIAPPQRRRGVFVTGGRCSYQLQTLDPTGVVRVIPEPGPPPTTGELFALWGEPLARDRLAGFSGPVTAFVGGRRWIGDPGAIPLTRHAQIELELGPLVEPHPAYLFPRGL